MNTLYFWKDWQRPYKQIYWLLVALFLVSVLFYLVSWTFGEDISFPWETYAQAETVKITIDTITLEHFSLPLEVDNYLITESFQGGQLTLYKWPSYVFVALLGLIFTLAITCITTLNRFSYLVGMGLIIAFLMSLQLENLGLFARLDKTGLIVAFLLYIPLSCYFHFINNQINFSKRLWMFAGTTFFFTIIIYFSSEVQYPFLYLSTYGYVAPIIISLLFIMLVAHELLTGFIFVITHSNNSFSKNSLRHFLIISSIYLVNLIIVVLDEIGYLPWEFFNFHPLVLLLLSSLIGLWLYRYREDVYQHIYLFYPLGAFVYLMLGTVCFFTIGFYLFSANDSIVEVFQDMILYAHFGYGIIFFVYIMANFLNPLGTNLQVYKVLYKPQYMPYFTYRLAGTIATLALVLVNDYNTPIFQSMASYYNKIGDLHNEIGDDKIASVYYHKAGTYDYRNHRTNYTMGAIARTQGNHAQAALRFSDALPKRPTPQAYINMSNNYLDAGKFFDGLFTIKDGVERFEHDDRSKVNLGLLYDKSQEPDSAYSVFQQARSKSATQRSANTNILALLNKKDYELNPDSIIAEYFSEKDPALIANGMVLFSARKTYWEQPLNIDSTLNLVTGHALYNKAINHIYAPDSSYLGVLKSISNVPANSFYKEKLQFATALGYHAHGRIGDAFRLMNRLANNDPEKSGYYYYVLGLWSLEQEANLLASDYFEQSSQRQYPQATHAYAIALSQAGEVENAMTIWDSLLLNPNPLTRQSAEYGLSLLSKDSSFYKNDNNIYNKYKYLTTKENEFAVNEIIERLHDNNYKCRIFANQVAYFLSKSDTTNTKKYAAMQATIANQQGSSQLVWTRLAYLDFIDSLTANDLQVIDNKKINKKEKSMLQYYKARISRYSQDSTITSNMFRTTDANPFFERGVIGKVAYLNSIGENMQAYNTLLNAIEINPYAVNLHKQYTLQCARMGFDTFGEYALEELRQLISGLEYNEFKNLYEYKLKKYNSQYDYE